MKELSDLIKELFHKIYMQGIKPELCGYCHPECETYRDIKLFSKKFTLEITSNKIITVQSQFSINYCELCIEQTEYKYYIESEIN